MTEQPPRTRRPAAGPATAQPPVQPAYAPAPPQQPAYAPAARSSGPARLRLPAGRDPVGPAPTAPGGSGGFFSSSRGKTIGLIVAGVVVIGALGGIGAAIFGGDDEDAFTDTTTGGTVEPGEEVTPEPDGGHPLAEPDRLGHARAQRRDRAVADAEPSPLPTDEATPTLDPEPGGDVVTIGNGVQVPVLPGWQVFGQGDSDVLLGDNQNSFVYAITGTVDPSADAASVIAASIDSILPKQTYTQLRKTDIAPLQAFRVRGVRRRHAYQATWTDQQAGPLQGLLICAVRQDGTALIITADGPRRTSSRTAPSRGPSWSTRRSADQGPDLALARFVCGYARWIPAGYARRIRGVVKAQARRGRWRWRRRPRRGR